MVPPYSDRVSRAPPYSKIKTFSTRTRLSLSKVNLSMLFRFLSSHRLAGPVSLATTSGVSFDFLSCRYLDVSVPRVRFFHPMYSDEDNTYVLGCPIRIFSDQCLFSAPRNFSQSITSFVASHRQGIHQMPFVS